MEISNARIKDVTVCLDDRDRLSAMMTFEGLQDFCYSWSFVLTNPTDVQRLMQLMSYTGTHNVENLNGKIVRKVCHDSYLRGFGHPIEDKFVPIWGEEFTEVSETQFEEMLKYI